MDYNTIMLIAQEALEVTMWVCAPILLTALALGLLIGMLQAATQIQEMTLSFIPKMIGLGAALLLAGALSLIHKYEPTRPEPISDAVFCL